MDLSQDVEVILDVLKRGVNVGFDTVGKLNYCPDSFRAQALKRIDQEGMLSHVVLSMDITRKSHLKSGEGLDMGICLKYSSPCCWKWDLHRRR